MRKMTFQIIHTLDEWRLANEDIDTSLPFVVEKMLGYFKKTQQWEKLTRVLPVYIGSKLSQPGLAILLRAIDFDIFGDHGPERPYDHSIDKQMEL